MPKFTYIASGLAHLPSHNLGHSWQYDSVSAAKLRRLMVGHDGCRVTEGRRGRLLRKKEEERLLCVVEGVITMRACVELSTKKEWVWKKEGVLSCDVRILKNNDRVAIWGAEYDDRTIIIKSRLPNNAVLSINACCIPKKSLR